MMIDTQLRVSDFSLAQADITLAKQPYEFETTQKSFSDFLSERIGEKKFDDHPATAQNGNVETGDESRAANDVDEESKTDSAKEDSELDKETDSGEGVLVQFQVGSGQQAADNGRLNGDGGLANAVVELTADSEQLAEAPEDASVAKKDGGVQEGNLAADAARLRLVGVSTIEDVSVSQESSGLERGGRLPPSLNEETSAGEGETFANLGGRQNADASLENDDALAELSAQKQKNEGREKKSGAVSGEIDAKTQNTEQKTAVLKENAASAGAFADSRNAGEGEGRGRGGRRERSFKVEVRDMRGNETQQTQNARVTSDVTQEVRHISTASGKETEILVELKTASPVVNVQGEGQASGAERAAGSLENFLSRELHNNLNGDIVREANIMLRSGGDAVIRLALHPATLGNVKIKLEVIDNKIQGKIIVQSEEALRAFKNEISSLEDAFCAQGFDGAQLDTALAGGGNAQGDAAAFAEYSETLRTLGEAKSASRYDEVSESAGNPAYSGSLSAGKSVDVFV